ncbi:MAG: RHS repeat-associated core domain-containing protein [Bacteroidota bacterium]
MKERLILMRSAWRMALMFAVFLLASPGIDAQCICSGSCANGIDDIDPIGDPELFCAVGFLCSEGILDEDDGTFQPNENIIRQDIAKVLFISLYGDQNIITIADSFPTPFADLQGNWIEYYKYAKAMSYLEYGDGISVFDRDFYMYRPGDPILRREIAKAIVEAYNFPLSTNTVPYFSDVAPGDPGFVYVQTVRELGIVDPAPTFEPTALTTRGEAFLMVYRSICNANIASPADDDYFMPGNYHPFNFNNRPSLSDASFDAYSKTSFSIPGRNIPLIFAHNYNSYLTELPEALFPICPLGRGWSHTYNSYIVQIPGYANQFNTLADRYVVFWPGGSMYDFTLDGITGVPTTRGIYDQISATSTQITITKKNQMVYVFEKPSANSQLPFTLRSVTDRNGNTVTLTYQGTNLTAVTGTAGRTLSFTYDNSSGISLLAAVTDPLGRQINFMSNTSAKDLIQYTDAEGKTTSYGYATGEGSSHLLTNITLPNGNTIDNEYEDRKLTSTRTNNSSTGQSINTAVDFNLNGGVYAGASSMMTVDDGNSPPRQFAYQMNGQNNLASMTTPTNQINQVMYTDTDNPNLPTMVEVDNIQSEYLYDNQGNVLRITQPENVVHQFTYTPLNDIDVYTNPRGFDTDFNYDGNGNLNQIVSPIGTTNMTYNSAGQPISITNPEGITVTFGYNQYGNQNRVTAPDGIESTAVYDLASRLTSSTNPNGQTTQYDYDARDFIIRTTDALSFQTQFSYDDNGNLVEIENARGGITTLNYDENDFLTSESFGGFTKQYEYDEEGKLTRLVKPDGTNLDYSYDPNTGNLTDDDYATYSYDGRNRLRTVSKDNETITYGYDDLNRITSITYDNETVGYGYDANSNVTTLTYPDNKVVTYGYDAKDRLISVTDWNNQQTTYTYLDDDRLSTVIYPNGISTDYEYDNAGRMIRLIHYRSGTPWIRYEFGLDDLGNHLSETEIDEPFGQLLVDAENFTYAYNGVNRITSLTGDQGTNLGFTFDDNGNTLTKGSTTYAWDDHDMLTNYTSTALNAQYQYDGLGNRRVATRNNITTRYTLDILGMSRVLIESDGGGNARNYYVYGLGLISRIKPDGDTRFYTYDFRGSTIAMTDENQNVTHSYNYTDFGSVDQVSEEDFNGFRYVGKYGVEFEDANLFFIRARYYDQSIGRFLSEDPIWNRNLYQYSENNPIGNFDVNGAFSLSCDEAYKAELDIQTIRDEVGLSLYIEGADFAYGSNLGQAFQTYQTIQFYIDIYNEEDADVTINKVIGFWSGLAAGALGGAGGLFACGPGCAAVASVSASTYVSELVQFEKIDAVPYLEQYYGKAFSIYQSTGGIEGYGQSGYNMTGELVYYFESGLILRDSQLPEIRVRRKF